MLVFNNKSWHYRLILYTFGSNFFTEIDWPESFRASEAVNELTYVRKPKTVNFCPYCRALVGSVIGLPALYLWRKLPHKPKKERSHAEIMKSLHRRNIIIIGLAGSVNIGLGIWKLTDGEYLAAGLQIGIGVGIIFMQQLAPQIGKFLAWLATKKKHKVKLKPKTPKEKSKLVAKLEKKHDIICPPIFFVDKQKEENLK